MGNEQARRLYARLGFVEYGIEKNSLKYFGKYYDEILMAKELGSETDDDAVPAAGEIAVNNARSSSAIEFGSGWLNSRATAGRRASRPDGPAA